MFNTIKRKINHWSHFKWNELQWLSYKLSVCVCVCIVLLLLLFFNRMNWVCESDLNLILVFVHEKFRLKSNQKKENRFQKKNTASGPPHDWFISMNAWAFSLYTANAHSIRMQWNRNKCSSVYQNHYQEKVTEIDLYVC